MAGKAKGAPGAGGGKPGGARRVGSPGYGGRIGSRGRPGGPGAPSRPTRPARPDRPPRPERPGRPAGPGGEILFYAWTIDGTEPTPQEDIFAFDTATGAVRRLTDDSSGDPFVSDRDPAWSPDRSRIVLMRGDATAPLRLVLLTAAGAPLGEMAVEGTMPAWLDDGTVLCSVYRLGAGGFYDRADIVAAAVPGGAQTAVSALAAGEFLGAPAWHPVSGLAATLVREDPTTHETLSAGLVLAPAAAVEAVLAGGPALTAASFTALTTGDDWDTDPAWSPDGTRLAFSTLRPCATRWPDGTPLRQSEIALLALADPARVALVTDDRRRQYDRGINDGSPAFSPDGTWLAWARGHEDDWTQLVVQQLGRPATRTVVLNGKHWFRYGLDW